MHITVRHYETKAAAEVTRIVNEKWFPLISKITGFVAYYAFEPGGDRWCSISIFETAEGANESNAVAAEFIHTNAELVKLINQPPEIIAGSIVAQLTK